MYNPKAKHSCSVVGCTDPHVSLHRLPTKEHHQLDSTPHPPTVTTLTPAKHTHIGGLHSDIPSLPEVPGVSSLKTISCHERGHTCGSAGEGVVCIFDPWKKCAPGDRMPGGNTAQGRLQLLVSPFCLAVGLWVIS